METIHPNTHVTAEQIAAFCAKHQITQMELFGSILRDDFDDQSDVDVLVVFAPEAYVTLFTLVNMEDELAVLFGRKVDLVERVAVERNPNPIRRRSILESSRLIYAAA